MALIIDLNKLDEGQPHWLAEVKAKREAERKQEMLAKLRETRKARFAKYERDRKDAKMKAAILKAGDQEVQVKWEESDHPRDESGRFGSGGGGSGSSDSGRDSSSDSGSSGASSAHGGSHAIASEPHTPPPPGKEYHPSVEADANNDGVTDASRVGVPADSVPPPPKEIPRLPNLTEGERQVEDEFAKQYEAAPDKVAADFLKLAKDAAGDGPPTFGTDDAKLLHKAWNGSGISEDDRAVNRATLNCAMHQTANAVAKRAFVQHLDTLPPGSQVLVTCGGCGCGKGYSLKMVDEVKAIKNQSQAVWDSAGDQNATENPWIQKECEARGLKATYLYVHADPEKQWADPKFGVVQRANDPKDGRMVDAKVFADSYAIGAKNMAAFYLANKDNKAAGFVFMDNTTKPLPTRIDGVPKGDLIIDRKVLTKFAMDTIASRPDLSPRVVRGATIGARIWKDE